MVCLLQRNRQYTELGDELFDALDHQANGYHFFTHPTIGLGALLHVDGEWTLVLNTGTTITAPKDKLVTLLAMAHWQMMSYLQDVGMVVIPIPPSNYDCEQASLKRWARRNDE